MVVGPSVHVRALATWLAVYPLITAVLALVRPLLGDAPLPVQTLVLTAVVVPSAVYIVVPRLLRLLTGVIPAAPTGAPAPAGNQEDIA